MTTFLIAIAGAAGALTRYGIGRAVGPRTFPWATMGINVSGSFVLAFLVTLGAARDWPETITVPLAVGFLGAYTTFSTFSYETLTLMRTDRAPAALAYIAASVLTGLAAAALGYAVGRRVA